MKRTNNTKHYFVLSAILILSFHGFSQENDLIDKMDLTRILVELSN